MRPRRSARIRSIFQRLELHGRLGTRPAGVWNCPQAVNLGQIRLSNRRKPEGIGQPPPPEAREIDLGNRGAVVGVHHAIGGDQDRRMLGRQVRAPAKQQHVAGQNLIEPERHQMPRGGGRERLVAAGLGPVGGVGRGRFRLRPVQRAPHTAHQAETIAAHALERGLVAIGRADPGAGFGDDGFTIERRPEAFFPLPP